MNAPKRSSSSGSGNKRPASKDAGPVRRGNTPGSAPGDQKRSGRSSSSSATRAVARGRASVDGSADGQDESFRARRLASSRFGIVYDIEGPRVRLGVIWFLAVMAAVVMGVAVLGILVAGVSALAAAQAARVLRTRWRRPDIATSALIGAAIPLAAIAGTGLAGLVVVCSAVVSVVASSLRADRTDPVIDAGGVLRAAVFAGLAAASLVILYRLDVGAVLTLVLLISAYEVGDYLIGTGAGNVIEGPASGILALFIVTAAAAVIQPPPFVGAGLWIYAGFAAASAPLGQILASAILPRAGAPARALRRLDSYLLAGPLWVVLIWGGVGI